MPLVYLFLDGIAFREQLAVARRETNGWKWPIVMVAYLFALAWLAAGATYWIAVSLGL